MALLNPSFRTTPSASERPALRQLELGENPGEPLEPLQGSHPALNVQADARTSRDTLCHVIYWGAQPDGDGDLKTRNDGDLRT